MEKLKAKHDHKLTDILKVLIFAIFLMLPFMVYCPNALYYGHNEHSTNETQTTVDIQYKYESNEVNSLDDLIVGNIYTLHTKNIDLDSFLGDGNYIDFYILTPLTAKTTYLSIEDSAIVYTIDRDTIVSLSNEDYSYYIYTYYNFEQYDNGDPTITYTYSGIFEDNIIIKLISFNLTSTFYISKTDYNEIESVDVNENVENTITESMNKAWKRMWETQMFNWTNESVLKQGLDNFTGVFGVTDTSYFTNLIVYELIMVAIYIVIDIVITMFKWLTHLIGEK